MKKHFIALIIFFIFASIFLGFRVFGMWEKTNRAGLVVTTPGQTHTVLINNKPVGETPYSGNNLTPGEVTLGIDNFSTQINLEAGTETVIRRTICSADKFSFGDSVWLEKSAGPAMLSILAEPEETEVLIDGESKGFTPLALSEIAVGTHTVELKKDGYRPTIIDLNITPGYRTYLSSNLMLFPFDVHLKKDNPHKISLIKSLSNSAFKVYDFSTKKQILYSDTKAWSKGIRFFIDLFELDLPVFNYFVDYRGVIYDSNSEIINPDNLEESESDVITIGYLGKGDFETLPEESADSLNQLKQALSKLTKKAVILSTGTGWLRVREKPSLNSGEITKVNVGDKFVYLDEQNSWVKIQLEDSSSGWVYADYVEIIEE